MRPQSDDPDIEHPRLDVPSWASHWSHLRRLASRGYRGNAADRIVERAEAALARPADAFRWRAWPDAKADELIVRRPSKGAARVRRVIGRAGLAELVNMPDPWSGDPEAATPIAQYDYRVRFRVAGEDSSGRLEVEALCIIARPGGPPVTPGAVKGIRLRDVEVAAARALALSDDGRLGPATDEDVRAVLRPESAGPRYTSSANARRQVDAVPDALRRWEAGEAAPGEGKRAFVARILGCTTDQAKERMKKAAKLGLIPEPERGRARRPGRSIARSSRGRSESGPSAGVRKPENAR